MAEIIDKRLRRASIYLFYTCSFNVILVSVHSASLDGSMYLPWNLTGNQRLVAVYFSIAYLAFGLFMYIMSFHNKPSNDINTLE